MPLGRIVHNYDDNDAALWNANFEEGLRIAKATDAKEVWQGRAAMPTHPPHGRHHHGDRSRQLRGQQLRPDPRGAEPLRRRPRHFPDRRRVEPDLHDFALSLRGAENLAANWSTVAG